VEEGIRSQVGERATTGVAAVGVAASGRGGRGSAGALVGVAIGEIWVRVQVEVGLAQVVGDGEAIMRIFGTEIRRKLPVGVEM
jgi:hypothetical protein